MEHWFTYCLALLSTHLKLFGSVDASLSLHSLSVQPARTTQLGLCSRRRGDPTPRHYCTNQLHWLPVQQRITYKLAFLTYKVRSKSTSVYHIDRITEPVCSRTLRSSAIPLLVQPFTRTDFSRRAFRLSAPSDRNLLAQTVLISDFLYVYKI